MAPTEIPKTEVSTSLPAGVWILIGLIIYIFFILGVLLVKKLLGPQVICSCGSADQPNDCCECWLSFSESCNPIYPSKNSLCGARKRLTCPNCCDCNQELI